MKRVGNFNSNIMTIEQWWANARSLAVDLANQGTSQVSTSSAKTYSDVRHVLFPNDSHHPPFKTKANSLLEDLQDWMTSVKEGTYNNRFHPKHTGTFTP